MSRPGLLATAPPPIEVARLVWAHCATTEPREVQYDVAGLAMRVGGRWYVGKLESMTTDARSD